MQQGNRKVYGIDEGETKAYPENQADDPEALFEFEFCGAHCERDLVLGSRKHAYIDLGLWLWLLRSFVVRFGGFQFFQRLLGLFGERPMRQYFQILLIVRDGFARLIQFFVALRHPEISNRIFFFPDKGILITSQRGTIVPALHVELADFIIFQSPVRVEGMHLLHIRRGLGLWV